MKNKYIFRDGRYYTRSGADITQFIKAKRGIWSWLSKASDKLVVLLIPKGMHTVFSQGEQDKFTPKARNYMAGRIDYLFRMAKAGEYKKFTKLAFILSKHSKVFRWWLYDNTSNGKFVNLASWKQLQVHQEYQDLIVNGKARFAFKRVWIPKPDGSLRPLAVPQLADRFLAKWMLVFLSIWSQATPGVIHPNQMGGVMAKSTASAWNFVLKHISNKRWIFEFDIAKCFDTISWRRISEQLNEDKVPLFLKNYILMVIKTSHLSLTDEENAQQKWSMRRIRYTASAKLLRDILSPIDYFREWIITKWENHNQEELDQWKKWESWMSALRQYQKQGIKPPTNAINHADVPDDVKLNLIEASRKSPELIYPDSFWENKEEILGSQATGLGIPQGWALSPFITNIILKNCFPKSATWVTFLDDGMLAADDPTDLRLDVVFRMCKWYGMLIHPIKSGWIKKEGGWLTDIKFLGAKWNPMAKTFRAATRTGSTTELHLPKSLTVSGTQLNLPQDLAIDDFLKEIRVDEANLAYIYNKGEFTNAEGVKVPLTLERMWEMSWRSKRMKKWRRDNPQAMEALKRYQSKARISSSWTLAKGSKV